MRLVYERETDNAVRVNVSSNSSMRSLSAYGSLREMMSNDLPKHYHTVSHITARGTQTPACSRGSLRHLLRNPGGSEGTCSGQQMCHKIDAQTGATCMIPAKDVQGTMIALTGVGTGCPPSLRPSPTCRQPPASPGRPSSQLPPVITSNLSQKGPKTHKQSLRLRPRHHKATGESACEVT